MHTHMTILPICDFDELENLFTARHFESMVAREGLETF